MLRRKRNAIVWTVLGVGILALFIYGLVWLSQRPGPLDGFAQCLEDKGAKFYGTFWCPVCKKQKDRFGVSQKRLPYVECSTPDGKGQLEVCTAAGIDRYPTWTFGDQSREIGDLPLETLAQKTGCQLPNAQ